MNTKKKSTHRIIAYLVISFMVISTQMTLVSAESGGSEDIMDDMEFMYEITSAEINKIGGISVEAKVSASELGENVIVVFKLLKDDTIPISIVAVQGEMDEYEKTYIAQFLGYQGDEYSVKILVLDEIDVSTDRIGKALSKPVTVN